MKRYSITFVDTENCSISVLNRIISYTIYGNVGTKNIGVWCYGFKDGKSVNSEEWYKQIEKLDEFHWNNVPGNRTKNAVDNLMINDISRFMLDSDNNRINEYIIATADGDFADIVEQLKQRNKYVTIIHSGDISHRLIYLCDKHLYG